MTTYNTAMWMARQSEEPASREDRIERMTDAEYDAYVADVRHVDPFRFDTTK